MIYTLFKVSMIYVPVPVQSNSVSLRDEMQLVSPSRCVSVSTCLCASVQAIEMNTWRPYELTDQSDAQNTTASDALNSIHTIDSFR